MRKLFDAKDIHHSEHLTELFLAVPEPSLVEKNGEDGCVLESPRPLLQALCGLQLYKI